MAMCCGSFAGSTGDRRIVGPGNFCRFCFAKATGGWLRRDGLGSSRGGEPSSTVLLGGRSVSRFGSAQLGFHERSVSSEWFLHPNPTRTQL